MTSEVPDVESRLDRPAKPTENNNQINLLGGNPSKNLDIIKSVNDKSAQDDSVSKQFGKPEILGDLMGQNDRQSPAQPRSLSDYLKQFQDGERAAQSSSTDEFFARHQPGHGRGHERGRGRGHSHDHGHGHDHGHERGHGRYRPRERRVPAESRPEQPETGTARSTKINGREVTIRYDEQGRPKYVKDHTGEWNSTDGGKTWVNKRDENNVRRGEVSIDENGNYIRTDTDYGTRTTHHTDGSRRQEIKTGSGERYVVGTDRNGRVNYFKDNRGEWSSPDGKNWTNSETQEKRRGRASMSEYGEFNFNGERGDKQTTRSEELESIKQKQKELSEKYGIQFVPPGRKHDGHVNGVPTKQELDLLQEVLERTSHVDYRGVKMWFIRPDGEKPDNKGNKGDMYGYYVDKNMVIMPRARSTPEGFDAMEGTLYHELGHHEQERTFPEQWGSSGDPRALRDLMREMGWHYDPHHGMLIKDKDGGMWKYNKDTNEYDWKKGKRPRGDRSISPEEMTRRALVKPSTDYNHFPYETHAEGIAMLRYNPTLLASKSPQLYKVLRDWDQKQLDKRHGEGKVMRGVDGRVVPNTPENRERRRRMEQETGVA